MKLSSIKTSLALSRLLLLFLGSIPMANAAGPAPHPYYSQLKAYRNYFVVTDLKPVADYFDVWFTHLEGLHCSVPVESLATLASATKKSFDCQYGGFGLPPIDPLKPVPADKTALADAVKQAVLGIYPGARDFQIAYSGRAGVVTVREIIPIRDQTDPNRRATREATSSYMVDETGTVAKPYGMQGSSSTWLCMDVLADRCAKEPQLIDVTLPDESIGKSVLASQWEPSGAQPDPSAQRAIGLFKTALLKTVSAIRAGSYANPALGIFAAEQGAPKLPVGFKQTIKYTVEVSVRKAGPPKHGAVEQPSDKDRLVFEFDATEAYLTPVTRAARHEIGQIDGEATLDLKAMTLTLKMTDSHGKTYAASYAVKGSFIVAGSGPADLRLASQGDLFTKQTGGDQPQGSWKEFAFDGFDGFSAVTCHPNGLEVL